MESWTIKVDDAFAKEVEKLMKPLYTTKTEFIRDAIRKHISYLEKERALKALRENFGKGKGTAKTKMTDEEVREQVFAEYAKKHGWS